jgi:hypothetical protein
MVGYGLVPWVVETKWREESGGSKE